MEEREEKHHHIHQGLRKIKLHHLVLKRKKDQKSREEKQKKRLLLGSSPRPPNPFQTCAEVRFKVKSKNIKLNDAMIQ